MRLLGSLPDSIRAERRERATAQQWWFAWRPVYVTEGSWAGCMVWLEKVLRRLDTSNPHGDYWQYARPIRPRYWISQ